MYDSLKPGSTIRFFDQHPISDTIEIPENGWKLDEIPFEADKDKLKKCLIIESIQEILERISVSFFLIFV